MLFDIHRVFGYVAIVANFLAGAYTLCAWKWPKLRNRGLWWPTITAEGMMLIQVFLGVLLVAAQHYQPPRFHMFYGFVAFITVGLLYSYRYVWRARLDGVGLRIGRAVHHGTRDPSGAAGGEVTKRRVLLLFGGRSAEHDVSRVTAVAVAQALDPDKYEVVPVAITTDGRWLLADDTIAQLEGARARSRPRSRRRARRWSCRPIPPHTSLVKLDAGSPLAVDVVLPLLHGPYGEDGTVQGLLELAGLPYVGAGVVGSAVGMDKIMMKRALAAAGLAQARYLAFRDGRDAAEFALRVEAELGLPCFVKPSNMGSSIGVSKVRTSDELRAAMRTRWSSTSGSSRRRRSSAARSKWACSVTIRRKRRCREKWFRPPISTTTPTNTKTGKPSCSCPPR